MLGLVLPGATLVYAWTLQQRVGGMGVPIAAGFFGGVGLMGGFNGLNTYAAGLFPLSKQNKEKEKVVVDVVDGKG